jgi:4-hydroxyisophthalate hydroxylase
VNDEADTGQALHLATQVAIVGGGPVGTALAIGLAQSGIECVLIERHRNPQQIPKGQNLTQRTMEHFRRWGIEQRLRDARTLGPDQRAVGMTAYGSLLGQYRYTWFERGLVDPYYWAKNERLPQYATERVLRDRVAELPAATTLYEWSALGVAQDEHGATVAIRSAAGRPGAVRAEFVVGCDGSRSTVRAAAGITQTLSDEERRMVLLVFRSAGFEQIMQRYPGTTFVNILNPELNGYWQFFGRVDARDTWFFHAPVAADATAETLDLHSLLARAAGEQFDFTVEHLGFWDLRFALADSYRAGRLFIAGDAAHNHPPYGGYGVNTGFEDATNLAWKLAAVLKSWAGENLLDSYDAERRPVFASTRDNFIAKAIRSDRDFLHSFDPARSAVEFAAAWEQRAQGTPDEIRSYEPNYEGSPIVAGDAGRQPSALGWHENRARAGHHLAPVRRDDGMNAFESISGSFCLLAPDVAGAGPFVTAAAELGVPLRVVIIDAESVRELGSPHVLVRPDQFIAWAGQASAADAYHVLEAAIGKPGEAAGDRADPAVAARSLR